MSESAANSNGLTDRAHPDSGSINARTIATNGRMSLMATERAEQETLVPGGLSDLVPLAEPFHFTPHGLKVVGPKPTLEQCGQELHRLKLVRGGLDYNMGDLINLTERLFGEDASQVIDPELIDERVASELRFVTSKVSEDVRKMSPGWEYSKAVAHLPKQQQERWLQQALDQDWIASKLKSEIATASAGGSTAMRYLLIVDAKTESKQNELAKKLEGDGFTVTKRTGVKKERKAKAKAAKKATAKKASGGGKKKGGGTPRPYTRKRPKDGK